MHLKEGTRLLCKRRLREEFFVHGVYVVKKVNHRSQYASVLNEQGHIHVMDFYEMKRYFNEVKVKTIKRNLPAWW